MKTITSVSLQSKSAVGISCNVHHVIDSGRPVVDRFQSVTYILSATKLILSTLVLSTQRLLRLHTDYWIDGLHISYKRHQ